MQLCKRNAQSVGGNNTVTRQFVKEIHSMQGEEWTVGAEHSFCHRSQTLSLFAVWKQHIPDDGAD